MEHDDRRRGLGEGWDLRAGGESMPQADPRPTLVDRDVGSGSHPLTIVTDGEGGWDTTPSAGTYQT